MFLKIAIILFFTLHFGSPKPSLKAEEAKPRTKRSHCPHLSRILFRKAKELNKNVHEQVRVRKGQRAEMRRSTDIEVTDCCEVKAIMIESECRLLEQGHVQKEVKSQLLIGMQYLRIKLEHLISDQEKKIKKAKKLGRRKSKHDIRTKAPGNYFGFLTRTEDRCRNIVTDKSLSPVAYSEYFVQLFSSCKSCRFSRKCWSVDFVFVFIYSTAWNQCWMRKSDLI